MIYSDIHSYITHLHKKQEDLLEQVKDIQVEIEIIKEQKNVYVGEDGYLYFENVNFNEEITNVDFKIRETSENNVYLKFCETWERAGTLVDIYIPISVLIGKYFEDWNKSSYVFEENNWEEQLSEIMYLFPYLNIDNMVMYVNKYISNIRNKRLV